MRIGIDLMGSDHSPLLLFEAVLKAASQLKHTIFTVLATQSVVDSIHQRYHLRKSSSHSSCKIDFLVVADVIEMHDEPLTAIRQKKNSSLVVGIRFLKKNRLDAFVSAGNTGSLIASATLSLPLLPGVKRPALLALLPTEKGHVAVIDVGGNVSCKANHLAQFAQIGAAYQHCMQGIETPTVGLLNIGVESKKGTSEIRQAYQLLQTKATLNALGRPNMRFIGNIEGREVFQGKADVLVTDGFTGNVLLKASEGISFFIMEHLQNVLQEAIPHKKEEIMNDFRRRFDYDEYAGAIVCGVDRVLVKCHGKSSVKGMLNGILGAHRLVEHSFTEQIKSQLLLH